MKANRILLISILALVCVSGLLVAVLVLTARNSDRIKGSTTAAPVVQNQIAGVDPAAPATQLVASGSKASWSADGHQIMFGGQGGVGLQVLDLQTRATRSLGFSAKDPAWSPAGTAIACVRSGAYGSTSVSQNEDVWLLPTKEGTARRVIRGGFPSWSPDGSTLYVHSRAEKRLLAIKADDLDAPPTVFYDKTPSGYYTVAPDGRQVAFGNRNQLEIRDRVTGAVTRQWPTPGERGLLPAWSPDGELVAFGGFNDSHLGVWIFQVATGRAVPVQEGQFTMPAWSAGGHWLAFDQRAGRSNSVWLVGRPYLDQLFSGPAPAHALPSPRE